MSCCRRCCRSTRTARSCTRATSSASTPGASTRPARRLEALGLSLDAAVTTFDYSTPETRDVYRRTHRERKNRLGGAGVFPGAGGILMSRLHRPGVLVALDVTASRLPLTAVNPGWTRYDTLTYTPGVLAGDTLYMSGFAALDMETQEALLPRRLARRRPRRRTPRSSEVLDEAGAGPRTSSRTCSSTSAPTATAPAIARRVARGARFPGADGVGRRVRRAAARRSSCFEVFPTAVLA